MRMCNSIASQNCLVIATIVMRIQYVCLIRSHAMVKTGKKDLLLLSLQIHPVTCRIPFPGPQSRVHVLSNLTVFQKGRSRENSGSITINLHVSRLFNQLSINFHLWSNRLCAALRGQWILYTPISKHLRKPSRMHVRSKCVLARSNFVTLTSTRRLSPWVGLTLK